MNTEQMRSWVKKPYPSKKWSETVDCMSEEQVYAIYRKFVASGKFKASARTSSIRADKYSKYHCTACGAEYIRDNPDLIECEICGIPLD